MLEDQLRMFQTLESKHAKHVNVRDQTMFFGLKKDKKKKNPFTHMDRDLVQCFS